MPDKPLTVLTYAASASLAAAALVYFFNPNQFIDGDSSANSASNRKKGVVGLVNPANDCFINSVLQSLAGLGDLRLFLIREVHRREIDGASVYTTLPEKDGQAKEVNSTKLISLQSGEVTRGLKCMLDQLNERPIYRKTISAQSFIAVLENAFGSRISRAQQDAQELLQIVAERLSEEYSAGKQARQKHQNRLHLRPRGSVHSPLQSDDPGADQLTSRTSAVDSQLLESFSPVDEAPTETEDGFPLEGQTEARVECQHCHFVPKPIPTNFVMLNLMVPQKGAATLNECFDNHFKTEYIDDYKCDRCRLEHAIETLEEELVFAKSSEQRDIIQSKIDRVRKTVEMDPEKPPERVQLPEIRHAPKRKVARHVQITKFPKTLVIHLSRSMFDPGSYSQKNSAKLSFPERLPIGGILNRRNYRLLGMITHRGTHSSGHYETFRRQYLHSPTSSPRDGQAAQSCSPSATPIRSKQPSPHASTNVAPAPNKEEGISNALESSSLSTNPSPAASSQSLSTPSTRPTSSSAVPGKRCISPKQDGHLSLPPTTEQPTSVLSPPNKSKPSAPAFTRYPTSLDLSRFKRKKKTSDRWWRISDDKIKECGTLDVLDMQRDVYMLFYEMDRNELST
ncbi:MAG: hypothetical protein Q9219_001915 [cf. Caloplaca sp. 3 TL-2023]